MNQNHNGQYKHYDRPQESRTATHKANSWGWAVAVACLIIILVALVPVVHHLASADKKDNQAIELRKAEKKHKQTKVKKSNKKETKKAEKKTKSKSHVKSQLKQNDTSGDEYVVKSGDTLSSIAAQFNVSVDDLVQLNNLGSTDQVYAGQTIKVK